MPDVLGQLTERGLLTPSSADAAREVWRGGVSLDEAILSVDGLNEDRLLPELAGIVGLTFLDLDDAEPDMALLGEIPARLLTTHRLLPISREGDRIRVATSRPFDRRGLDELRLATGLTPSPVLATSASIQRALATHLGVGAETVQSLVAERGDGVEILDSSSADIDLAEAAQDASIIQFVNQVLVEAIERRATDVHFEPFEHRLAVRYRIDGVLVSASIPAEVSRFQAAIVSRIKILSQLDIAEKRLPQDGRIKLKVAGREVDVRVSIIPMLHGEAVVLRILDRGGAVVSLDATGMAGAHRAMYESVLQLPHGIVLVTGPTGSGKTTSLYAGLAQINTIDRKIVTIEDPIEYHLDGVNQIQVDTKTGLTFARGLRSILRHDPDVVLIGEIRDRETAEISVQASLTGHLVFSTLHTNDAPGAVPRLIDMGVEPYLVASSLELVMAQRLVRLICPHCRQEVAEQESQRLRHGLNGQASHLPPMLYFGAGCRACNQTGYTGRRGIFEMMPMTDPIRSLATSSASSRAIRAEAERNGMLSLRDDGWRLVREGLTSVEEVLRVTKDEQTAIDGGHGGHGTAHDTGHRDGGH